MYQLGNSNILYTGGTGVHVLDPVNLTFTTVVPGVSGRFISSGAGITTPSNGAYCFGDGTGALCPCGNTGAGDRGCENGTLSGGGLLATAGAPSIAAADLVLTGTGLQPNQPGLYFQGDNATNGGLGFGNGNGDGLRCAGGNIRRMQIVSSNVSGDSPTTVDIGVAGAVNPGNVKRYQLWYRNPAGSPCGTGFNLSNGMEFTWAP